MITLKLLIKLEISAAIYALLLWQSWWSASFATSGGILLSLQNIEAFHTHIYEYAELAITHFTCLWSAALLIWVSVQVFLYDPAFSSNTDYILNISYITFGNS